MTHTPEDEAVLERMAKELGTIPYKQAAFDQLLRMGISPYDHLELRLNSREHSDVFKLAQRCADAFFSAFSLYPTALAAHSTIAALFEASEHTIKASHRGGQEMMLVLCGSGMETPPLHIEIDDSLDTRTIAARWYMGKEEAEEGAREALMRYLKGK